MCTVAFVPLATGGYLLGHNRDERPSRSAGEPPARTVVGERVVLAPQDPDGGGTWIGVNDAGLTVCILNAAERGARSVPDPPRSRGLIVRDLLPLGGVGEIRERLLRDRTVLDRTRSFHVVAAEPGRAPGNAARVAGLRWDGVATRWDEAASPTLFVSSLLYPEEAERARASGWRARVAAGGLDAAALASWLAGHEPARGALSVCMHRDDAGTVSRTLVEVAPGLAVLRYQAGPPCTPSSPEVRAELRW